MSRAFLAVSTVLVMPSRPLFAGSWARTSLEGHGPSPADRIRFALIWVRADLPRRTQFPVIDRTGSHQIAPRIDGFVPLLDRTSHAVAFGFPRSRLDRVRAPLGTSTGSVPGEQGTVNLAVCLGKKPSLLLAFGRAEPDWNLFAKLCLHRA